MKSVIIGTAGHIDHGKTSLVKALTGIDADRWEEEKRRGITIDLGFAHMQEGGFNLSFIDVPGHEKFVRNMLAGVGGIDLVLFVIAADEGVMPQTREHFEICRLLGLQSGVIALTKVDAADAEMMTQRRAEVRDFLRGSFLDPEKNPMIEVSVISGQGLGELKRALVELCGRVGDRSGDSVLRLPIDRVFTMRGFGTVVTGTLLSGEVSRETEIEIQPGRRRARVRGVQVHGEQVQSARAGERTALNLSGIDKEGLKRGDTIIAPHTFSPTRTLDAWVEVTRDARALKHRERVHLHAFTGESIAVAGLRQGKEIKPGECGFVQLRIERDGDAMLLLPGDRFVLRQFSPVVTTGGGVVLDAHPLNKRMTETELIRFLCVLRDGSSEERLLARIERRGTLGMTLADAVEETGEPSARIESMAAALARSEKVIETSSAWIASRPWAEAKSAVAQQLKEFHSKNPLAAGIGRDALRDKSVLREPIFSAVLDALVADKKIVQSQEVIHAADHKVTLRSDESAAHRQIEDAFRSAGLKVPAVKEVLMQLPLDRTRAQKIVTLLLRDKALVKITEDLIFHATALDALKRTLANEKSKSARLDVARFKDLTGVSRKYAIPLLEWLDRERLTKRVGDARVIL
ncbi:MAG: selenocysteine-specific translation elongation factor [Acidobacteriaceae bacterium]